MKFTKGNVIQPGAGDAVQKEAETHLPYLAMREGVFITMEDFSTGVKWTFRYRYDFFRPCFDPGSDL